MGRTGLPCWGQGLGPLECALRHFPSLAPLPCSRLQTEVEYGRSGDLILQPPMTFQDIARHEKLSFGGQKSRRDLGKKVPDLSHQQPESLSPNMTAGRCPDLSSGSGARAVGGGGGAELCHAHRVQGVGKKQWCAGECSGTSSRWRGGYKPLFVVLAKFGGMNIPSTMAISKLPSCYQ